MIFWLITTNCKPILEGNGQNYRGSANRGESGDLCGPWDSPYLNIVLDQDKIVHLGDLEGNNFCRNPDGDVAPWCITPNGEYDYCDIPRQRLMSSLHLFTFGETSQLFVYIFGETLAFCFIFLT